MSQMRISVARKASITHIDALKPRSRTTMSFVRCCALCSPVYIVEFYTLFFFFRVYCLRNRLLSRAGDFPFFSPFQEKFFDKLLDFNRIVGALICISE